MRESRSEAPFSLVGVLPAHAAMGAFFTVERLDRVQNLEAITLWQRQSPDPLVHLQDGVGRA